MRDQDTGEYLVQPLGGAPGASSHFWQRRLRQTVWLLFPVRPSRSALAGCRRRVPGSASLSDTVDSAREPVAHQLPASRLADGRGTAAGFRRCDPVAAGAHADAAQWGRAGWPTVPTWSLGSPAPRLIGLRGIPFVVASFVFESTVGSSQGRMLPYVIELGGQFCGQLTIGDVTTGHCDRHGSATGCPARSPVAALPPERWRLASITAWSGDVASRGSDRVTGECGEPSGAGKGRVPRGAAAAALPPSDGDWRITCWWV